ASRQQHQWIEAYLASADRPQPMIAVEVKFIETSRDPSSELGIDWNGVLRSGDTSLSFNNPLSTLASVGGGATLPTAVLSFSDLNAQLRAIYNDRKTRMVSYPRMVTLDNREVSFRSVINQPVLGSSSSASLGAGATETSAVEYLPIGTVINILPKRMAGNKILLNVSVTVSDIIGTEIIKGNPYPIATSRVYTAPLTVQSGYTVAISGLDAASANETETGIPILGRLPVIGNAFKNRRQDKSRQHLMMLITPVSLNTGTEGLTEKPITREPWKAAPAHSYPVTSGKAPVYDDSGRGLRARPIDEVPDFDNGASDRKASRTFGRIKGEIVEPSYANVAERSPAAKIEPEMVKPDPLAASLNASTLAPKAHPANTPMVVTTGDIGHTAEPVTAAVKLEKKAPAAAPAKAEEPKVEAAPVAPAAPVEAPEDPRLAEIRKKIGNLQADLAKIPEGDGKLSPDDGQLVLNVHEGAQKLLGEVEKVRSDKNQPLGGSLGDTWWDLINLKSQASKLSRRSPESLAVKSEAEGKPKSEPEAPKSTEP
ncbi:MAG TPA: hypothetical protein PLA50_07980, partial [Bacteroidia bacterium]|nr:hypothetical protein [Bacteroidia bacterium]